MIARHDSLVLVSDSMLRMSNSTDALSDFVGITSKDFKKADSDGVQIIEALQYKFHCSIIVQSDHDTRLFSINNW